MISAKGSETKWLELRRRAIAREEQLKRRMVFGSEVIAGIVNPEDKM